MQSIATKQELHKWLDEHGGQALVVFWKRGCPGCMKMSKLLSLLEDDTLPLIGFDCSGSMEEAKSFGVPGTPYWILFKDGLPREQIQPAADADALWNYLTEKAGFDLLRPFFDVALEEGKIYAQKVQDAIAEMMLRSGNDGDGILSAARLKILKACVNVPKDETETCIEEQLAGVEKRLRDRMAQQGETEARLSALKKLPTMKEEILRLLLERET